MSPLLLLLVLLAAGALLGLLVRTTRRLPPPATARPGRPASGPMLPARHDPWQARYLIDADATVWAVVRRVVDHRGEREEMQEIVRIPSAAPDFEQRFVNGERRAHERALLLNSSLSP